MTVFNENVIEFDRVHVLECMSLFVWVGDGWIPICCIYLVCFSFIFLFHVLIFTAFFFFLLYPASVLVCYLMKTLNVETVVFVVHLRSPSTIGEYVFLVLFHLYSLLDSVFV